jgi:dienelactone hydrolase
MPTLADMARMRVVHQVPGMDAVEVRRDVVYHEIDETPEGRMTMDVYLPRVRPAGGSMAGVLLIHGAPVPVELQGRVKNMGIFVSYGEMLAASGFVAAAFNHLHHGWHDPQESADNVAAAIAWLRGEAAALVLDPQRLCLWAFSGGGPQLAPYLATPAAGIRCLLAFYALLDLRRLPPEIPALPAGLGLRFSPAACLAPAAAVPEAPPVSRPPLLVARAGLDWPWMNQACDDFIEAALAAGMELEVWNHAAGRHGFDVLDDVPRSHEIVARALAFIRTHTAPVDAGSKAGAGAGADPAPGT